MLAPLEDLLGLAEQPNLPGTIDEHPNWRRRLPVEARELFATPDVRARAEAINRRRA
jgi:4-alpha-glucanotransferase